MVTQTSKDIARLTVLMRRGDKQQKLQIEKLTTDFKDALQRYSDMQKVFKYSRYNEKFESLIQVSIKPMFCFVLTRYFLQSIAEKMKRHILAMTNIENSMDGEDTEETQRLLQAQEQEHRSTQRLGKNICLYTKDNMFVHS